MRALLKRVLSWALPGSPGLSLVLGYIEVKEMNREMGVPKLIVKSLFSPIIEPVFVPKVKYYLVLIQTRF